MLLDVTLGTKPSKVVDAPAALRASAADNVVHMAIFPTVEGTAFAAPSSLTAKHFEPSGFHITSKEIVMSPNGDERTTILETS